MPLTEPFVTQFGRTKTAVGLFTIDNSNIQTFVNSRLAASLARFTRAFILRLLRPKYGSSLDNLAYKKNPRFFSLKSDTYLETLKAVDHPLEYYFFLSSLHPSFKQIAHKEAVSDTV